MHGRRFFLSTSPYILETFNLSRCLNQSPWGRRWLISPFSPLFLTAQVSWTPLAGDPLCNASVKLVICPVQISLAGRGGDAAKAPAPIARACQGVGSSSQPGLAGEGVGAVPWAQIPDKVGGHCP